MRSKGPGEELLASLISGWREKTLNNKQSAENRVAFAHLAWVATRDTLADDPEALRRRGLEHAADAERLDPSNAEAALRGVLLALDPATRAEGEALIAAAREQNGRLILDW